MSFDGITDLPDVPQAGTAASDVYTLALRSEYVDIQRCVRELGISEAEAAAAIEGLLRLRLLHLVHGCTYAYVAVNPMSASLQLLAVQDEALRQRQHELERLRQQMHSLLPLYQANFSSEPHHPHVQRVDDPRAARGSSPRSRSRRSGRSCSPSRPWIPGRNPRTWTAGRGCGARGRAPNSSGCCCRRRPGSTSGCASGWRR